MADKISRYLSPDQQAAVEAAVREAESRSSGEIVPMLVTQSDDYREAAAQAAAIIAAALGLAVSLALNDTSVWLFLPTAFILYFPALAVVRRSPSLKLAFTPAVRVGELVRLRAIRAFYERGLHRTREENGILIFISLLEHKVWILGDRGINAVIPPESWTKLASALSSGIREGRMAEALVATIAEVGGILQQHFQRRVDDANELPDLMGE
ncbi:MAG: TPM domain-containing protein [Deltaproteobacteria bacterium]|nr:TPM domain-containing protein [Deltaproteobacteria bacterium]